MAVRLFEIKFEALGTGFRLDSRIGELDLTGLRRREFRGYKQ